jgi:cytoskeletal protein CcmA (bactofilin family)
MLLTRKEPPAADTTSSVDSTSSGPSGLFRQAAAVTPAATDSTALDPATSHGKKLIVGQGISLSGEITACERLVVEGSVKVVLNKTRAIEITETGKFTDGKAEVDEAEISGVYEGELTVRDRLLIRATGRVTGTIRYGELEVERGGKLSGQLAMLDTRR